MGQYVFWAIAIALTLGVAGLLLAALLRGGAEDDTGNQDLQVFRDQLKEVERDLARGVIAPDEAERLRIELGRKVLQADAKRVSHADTTRPGPAGKAVAAVLLVVIAAISFGFYLYRGHPSLGDMPLQMRIAQSDALRAARLPQAEAEAKAPPQAARATPAEPSEHDALMAELRRVMAERPNDLAGQELLALNEGKLGNFTAAAKAQAKVIELKGPQATAADHSALAELYIMAASGTISLEAEAALARALVLEPSDPLAGYYSGLMLLQIERPDLAFRFWAALWENSAPTDPWVPTLQSRLPDVAWLAGQHRYELPALRQTRGPDGQAINDAAALSPEERQEMILGMVNGLMERLGAEGGTSAEWAQLIGALGVLGQHDRARGIWEEAKVRFAGRPEDLDAINAAAARAGVQ